jgi:hypothetical protein
MSVYSRGFSNSPLLHRLTRVLNIDIHDFARSIMAFPLSWRKFSLTALRVQEHPARNKRLTQELEILRAQVPTQVVIPGQDTFYNLGQLVASLALIDWTRAQRLKTFLMQWGRFLTQLTRKNPELSEDEIILMLAPIQSVYGIEAGGAI